MAGDGHRLIEGPAGRLELWIDAPDRPPLGLAIITHPQPLLGGSARHKVPTLLARRARDLGWLAVRPNFRGVGSSEGQHDEGRGEQDDVLAVIGALGPGLPTPTVFLLGFSFGAFVQAGVATRLREQGRPARGVVLAGVPSGTVEGGRHYALPAPAAPTTVIHGELDERVPLAAVFDWARPHDQAVTVVPGADHFFTGRLPTLCESVAQALTAAAGNAERPVGTGRS